MNRSAFSRRCDGITRRDWLRIGGLSAFGLGIGDLFTSGQISADVSSQSTPRAKSCILIWLDGGPSHLETFDLKPEAPKEVRGPLEAISTNVPGIHVSECLPNTAKVMDKVAVIRSMTSPLGEHNFGTHYLMTGYQPTPVLEYPAFPTVVNQIRDTDGILPSHVAVPNFRVGGSKLSGNGFLPNRLQPFSIGSDPARAGFKVRDLDFYSGLDLNRLSRRREFVNYLDRVQDEFENSKQTSSDASMEQAFRLITSTEAKQAFDLNDEPTSKRQRYGSKTVGQSCLLARRLVERGVPFVTVNQTGWDTHNNLYTRLKEGYTGARTPVGLIPSLDLAFSALIEDLDETGLLDETLIVVMGEFGRTPKLNTSGGRDHWPRVFSVALAGAGINGGQIIGSSDAVGESPKDRPVTPSQLIATIYKLLGVDPSEELRTADGRPVRVTPDGTEIIHELIG